MNDFLELLIGLFYLFLIKAIPIIFYFVVYLIRSKKWLTIYAFFWIVIYLFGLFQINCTDSYSSRGNFGIFSIFMSIVYLLFSFSETSILGIIGQFIVIEKRRRGYQVNLGNIHTIMLTIIILFMLDNGIIRPLFSRLIYNTLC